MAGLEPLVVFWTGWGIHFMVVVSFTVQVTLLLLADIRRRYDWVVLKVVIWSAYMLADTTAIYALGHMSVVCRSPEHQLMALWAPLLLVHLGGQDNITAYAIEDNRLWLRHLQTFVLQVAAAIYVLHVSSNLSHPSKLRSAAILMLVVGVLKYGERIWALKRADSCASSSLSATSYDKKVPVCRAGEWDLERGINKRNKELIVAYSLLDVPKQMFEGPATYVQIRNEENTMVQKAEFMMGVVEKQLWMMYDLLYTKAAVVHTWYGLCSRLLVSLPFTVAALALLVRSSLSNDDKDATAAYKRVDVVVTIILLVGAVVLETMSVVRAIFSKWTAVLLYARGWKTIGDVVFSVTRATQPFCFAAEGRSRSYYLPVRMRQHSLFVLMRDDYDYSVGRKMAKRMRMEDHWWYCNMYSWSTEVPYLAIQRVLELVSTTEDNITKSQGLNAVRRKMNDEQLVNMIWTEEEWKLEERILVWHIATRVYIEWFWRVRSQPRCSQGAFSTEASEASRGARCLANYMFSLLATRPYMLPYPVSRQAYVQLCHDVVTHFGRYCGVGTLVDAILNQKEALMEGTPLRPYRCIGRRRYENGGGETGAAAQAQPSMNSILDRGCQLAAKLIHITTKDKTEMPIYKGQLVQRQNSTHGGEEETGTFDLVDIMNMVFEVWVEMLCYTATLCNENYHAKHLTDGCEFMTIITLLMIYVKNGLIN